MVTMLGVALCYATKVAKLIAKTTAMDDKPDVIVVEENRDLQRQCSNGNVLTLNTQELSQFYEKLPPRKQPQDPEDQQSIM